MLNFSIKIYSEEEAFFESIKGLYEDEDLRSKAISAFTEYLKAKSKEDDKEYDFMGKWLANNQDITCYHPATESQVNAFGLDAQPWYINTDDYSEAE